MIINSEDVLSISNSSQLTTTREKILGVQKIKCSITPAKLKKNISMWVKKYLGVSKLFLAPKKSKSYFSLKLPKNESDFKN